MLGSYLNPKSRTVFLDLDIGRASALPEKWKNEPDLSKHQNAILKWASDEGFDLMGTEYEAKDSKRVFALRSIGMRAWELGDHRWKHTFDDITLGELESEGLPTGELLLHRDPDTTEFDPLATATFLYMTKEGTPGLLYVGVEVQDDSQKPGGIAQGDLEHDPVGFEKGRRFGFSYLVDLGE
jgi:hypothetical protein